MDGPWKLQSFNSDGNSTFVPNKAYSGSPKPTLAKFQEIPFTTESAQYNVLQASAAGGGGQKIDVGYLPTTDAPTKPANATVGTNPVHGYTLDPLYPWGINYFPVNFQSTTGNGPIIKQLYFREALAYLMNQQAVIQGPLHGYGKYTVGPVGTYPSTQYLSAKGTAGRPVPVQPGQGQAAADQPRLEGHAERGHDLRRRRRCAARASSRGRRSASPCRTHGDRLDRVGDDPAPVERQHGRHQAQPGAQAVQPGDRDRRRQLRGRAHLLRLGHGQLGRRLDVRA